MSRVVWIEEAFVLQHGASDSEQTIGDRSEGSCMAVAALAESGVFGLADRVVLYGDRRPLVKRVADAAVATRRRMTILLFPERLVTGATPPRHRRPW